MTLKTKDIAACTALINGHLDKIPISRTGCSLIVVTPPNIDALNNLAINKPAYFCCYGKIFYASHENKKYIEISTSLEKHIQFHTEMKPTPEGRILSEEELKKITSIMGHTAELREFDFASVVTALRSIIEPDMNHIVNDNLRDRISDILELIQYPEMYVQDPADYKEFVKIIKNRISAKITELENLSDAEKEHYVAESAALKSQGLQDKKIFAQHKPPETSAEGHVVSDEELLHQIQLRYQQAGLSLNLYAQNLTELIFTLARHYFVLKRYPEALQNFDWFLRFNPNHPEALASRGFTLNKLGRYLEALESYDHALQIELDDAMTLSNRGSALNSLGRYQEALESYDHALQIEPDDAATLNNRGSALNSLGRYQEALESYDRSLQIRPNHATALTNRGATLNSLGCYQEALESFGRSLQLNPNDAVTLNNRGSALDSLGRYQEALESYDHALQIEPNDATILANRTQTRRHALRFFSSSSSRDDLENGINPTPAAHANNNTDDLQAGPRF